MAKKAAAVVISNTVACTSTSTASSRSRMASIPASSISRPARRMRSLKRTRCGEVLTWTLRPAASAMARRNATVEPLPLVPAT